MSESNDHWKTVLQQGGAALAFRIINSASAKPTMVAEPAPQKRALPVMIYYAVAATAVVDRWVACGEGEVLIDRPAILARQSLLSAKAAEPPGSTPSPFTTGYATIYKLELSRLVWLAIIDDPAQRLEALAATFGTPELRTTLI